MTILISIASYRDPELVRTIKSAIENAANPNDLVFSVVIQDFPVDTPDLSWVKNLRLKTMHPREARGAGYARAIAMEYYQGEDYYLQIDSHTLFAKNWDKLCIDQHNKAKEISKNNKNTIKEHFTEKKTQERVHNNSHNNAHDNHAHITEHFTCGVVEHVTNCSSCKQKMQARLW